MDIVMADDGIVFDGDSMASGPLGGAETAFVSLAVALAGRGHRVRVFNMCAAPMQRDGVYWAPLAAGIPDRCDLYIANRSDQLLLAARRAKRAVFWIHNPARYLLKSRYLLKLALRRPPIVFSGAWHATTYPGWAPCGGRAVIPYGISDVFRTVQPEGVPPPRAVFTSNPLRGLDWLLDIWRARIRPACPLAELHLYTGAATYGGFGAARAERMRPVLEKADAMGELGVVRHGPVAKAKLARALAACRVLLYRGDPGETFCLAVGEAQAAGVPAVVQPIGCVAERVIDGETGFVARDDAAFADAAIRLLSDDALWRNQSVAALALQRRWGWTEAAAAFEALV
jgi:glycosyltransferase involved in cell wall biosynthesis